jgi:hypothetical protein
MRTVIEDLKAQIVATKVHVDSLHEDLKAHLDLTAALE